MAKLILFAAADFSLHQPGSRVFTNEVRNLGDHGFNDVVSSAIVIDGDWTLYSAADFGGTRWHLRANGGPASDGCYPNFADWQGENDVVSSIRPGIHDSTEAESAETKATVPAYGPPRAPTGFNRYAYPKHYTDTARGLATELEESRQDMKSGKMKRVVISDISELAIYIAPGELEEDQYVFSWAEFGKQFANGIVSGIAGWVVGYMLDKLKPAETIRLHDDALRAVRDTLQEIIDNSFFNHYMGEVTGIREQLLTYKDTGDQARLNSALDKGYALVPQLRGLHIKGFGGFVMAANLHLAALRAKSEIDRSYRSTFDRLRVEYAGMGISLANDTRARLEARVEHCSCTTTRPRPDGPDPETGCHFKHDWGRGMRHFSGTSREGTTNECRDAREVYYQGGTVWPILNIVNPLVDICNTWVQ